MFHLQVLQTNLVTPQFELLLKFDTQNQSMWLASDVSYAALKTTAAAMFKTVWVWDDTKMITGSLASL